MTANKTNTKENAVETLSADEKALLKKCKATVNAHMKSALKAGEAFYCIRENKLYRESGVTFEEYVMNEFNMGSRQSAYRYINAFLIVKKLKELGFTETPDRESQCRDLTVFLADESGDTLHAIWGKALALKEEKKDKVVTAAIIKLAVTAHNDPDGKKAAAKKAADEAEKAKKGSAGTGDTGEGEGPKGQSTGDAGAGADSESDSEVIRALKAELDKVRTQATMNKLKMQGLISENNNLKLAASRAGSQYKGSKMYKDLIKAGFKALSKINHPDTGGSAENMKALNTLYADLNK